MRAGVCEVIFALGEMVDGFMQEREVVVRLCFGWWWRCCGGVRGRGRGRGRSRGRVGRSVVVVLPQRMQGAQMIGPMRGVVEGP